MRLSDRVVRRWVPLVGGLMLLGGCGSSGSGTVGAAGPSTSAAPAASAPSTASAPTASEPAPCRVAQLAVTAEEDLAAKSGRVLLRNTSSQTCYTWGWPEVRILDAARQLRPGYTRSTGQDTSNPKGVTLAPGQEASFFYLFTNPPRTCTPTAPAAFLQVTLPYVPHADNPPDDQRMVVLPSPKGLSPCAEGNLLVVYYVTAGPVPYGAPK